MERWVSRKEDFECGYSVCPGHHRPGHHPIVGVGLGVPVTFSVMNGTLEKGNVTQFLGGWSLGFNAAFIVGGGFQLNGSGVSTEKGFGTPQIGANLGWNFCLFGPCH